MKKILRDYKLHTVCESAKCPNISECFANRTATFMVLGEICTRNCLFCGVEKGKPSAPETEEADNILEAIKRLKLKYAVLTMVTRDDLEDGGAEHFVKIITKIRENFPTNDDVKIEILTSDFYSRQDEDYESSLAKIIKNFENAKINVFSHNIETVPRLYPKIRTITDYKRSLNVLKIAKKSTQNVLIKTGIMLGLGEEPCEVEQTLRDILETGAKILTIGQYLAPSKNHYPVARFLEQKEFDSYKDFALNLGFTKVEAGPFVRSSYKAAGL